MKLAKDGNVFEVKNEIQISAFILSGYTQIPESATNSTKKKGAKASGKA